MATYVGQADGVKTSAEGHHKLESQVFTAGVSTNFSSTSLKVVQRGAGANMSVDVSVGMALLITPSALQSYNAWTDAATNVTITTADATNARIDAIVAYVDTTSFATTSNNSPGSFKFAAIAGTPSATPVVATNTAIQTALGTNVAWVPLATVTVAAAAASITNAVITDTRVGIKMNIPVGTSTVADSSISGVSSTKLSNPYKFSVYRNAAQNSTNGSFGKINLDTKLYDTGSNFDAVTNFRFTAPVAGFYHFSGGVNGPANASLVICALYKNGSVAKQGVQGYSSVNTNIASQVSGDLQLAATDYVELWAYGNGGALAVGSPAFVYLDGHFISAT